MTVGSEIVEEEVRAAAGSATKKAVGAVVEEEVKVAAGDAAKKAAGAAAEDTAKKAASAAAKEGAEEGASKAAKSLPGYNWVSGGAKLCYDNPKTCAGVAGATALGTYIGVKNKQASDEEKACKTVCLPVNWPDYVADPDNTQINYRPIPVTGTDGKATGFPADEVCKSPEKDCDKFCDDACHVSRSLLNDIPFMGNIEDTITDALSQIFGDYAQYIGTFLTIVIVIMIVAGLVWGFSKFTKMFKNNN